MKPANPHPHQDEWDTVDHLAGTGDRFGRGPSSRELSGLVDVRLAGSLLAEGAAFRAALHEALGSHLPTPHSLSLLSHEPLELAAAFLSPHARLAHRLGQYRRGVSRWALDAGYPNERAPRHSTGMATAHPQ